MTTRSLAAVGFKNTILKQIDAFDMNSVIDAVLEISNKELPPLFINITGGTNLMAGVALTSSFFVGASAYYVMGKTGTPHTESKALELPVLRIPYHEVIEKTQLLILHTIQERRRQNSESTFA